MAYIKTCTQLGDQNKDFGTVSQMDLNRSLVMSMTQAKLMTSFPKSFFKTKFCTAKDIVVNLSPKTYIEVLYFCSLTVSPQENGRNYCLPTIHGRFVGRLLVSKFGNRGCYSKVPLTLGTIGYCCLL